MKYLHGHKDSRKPCAPGLLPVIIHVLPAPGDWSKGHSELNEKLSTSDLEEAIKDNLYRAKLLATQATHLSLAKHQGTPPHTWESQQVYGTSGSISREEISSPAVHRPMQMLNLSGPVSTIWQYQFLKQPWVLVHPAVPHLLTRTPCWKA